MKRLFLPLILTALLNNIQAQNSDDRVINVSFEKIFSSYEDTLLFPLDVIRFVDQQKAVSGNSSGILSKALIDEAWLSPIPVYSGDTITFQAYSYYE